MIAYSSQCFVYLPCSVIIDKVYFLGCSCWFRNGRSEYCFQNIGKKPQQTSLLFSAARAFPTKIRKCGQQMRNAVA